MILSIFTYASAPVWIRIRLFKVPFCVNDFGQLLDLCDYSPVWVSMWVFKIAFR
jgi:hypothetical protein